ncbi:MAG: 3'-5' exonuclease domain-containing protein 2 [Akkermansiaceae bacterium]|nr:3'-5' exonuclease domain-containing protein 2 [Akkermansiaceae bacterium]
MSRHSPRSSRRSPRPSSPDGGSSSKSGNETRPVAPTKAETALLPAFPELTGDKIHIPQSKADCDAAVEEIVAAGVTGFDTEAKPTFRVGEKCGGPHVVQFALTDKAFLFQLHHQNSEQACAELIASKEVLKVGFGLKNDHGQIRNRLGIQLTHVLDLDQIFRKLGYRGQIGVRAAMGVLLNLKFRKSKSITTSNWAARELSRSQLLYAANDAYAALKILEALERIHPQLLTD